MEKNYSEFKHELMEELGSKGILEKIEKELDKKKFRGKIISGLRRSKEQNYIIFNPIREMIKKGKNNTFIRNLTLKECGFNITNDFLNYLRFQQIKEEQYQRLSMRSRYIREGGDNEDVRDKITREFRDRGSIQLEPIDLTDNTLEKIREDISIIEYNNKIYEQVSMKSNQLHNTISSLLFGISESKDNRCKYCHNTIDKEYLHTAIQLKKIKKELLKKIKNKISMNNVNKEILSEIKEVLNLIEFPNDDKSNKEIIYDLLKKEPMTTKEIAKKLDISINAVNTYICRLRDKGKIKTVGKKGRFKEYTIMINDEVK